MDALGDPLPAAAVARLGSVRLQHGFHTGCVCYSHDGRWLATTSEDRTVRIWDLTTGRESRRFPIERQLKALVAFTPDDQSLLTFDGDTVRVWNPATGKLKRRQATGIGYAYQSALSADSKLLVLGTEKRVSIWDWEAGLELRRTTNRGPPIAISANATLACTGEKVCLVDFATGNETTLTTVREAHSIVFSPDGKLLAIGDYAKSATLWDIARRKERFRLTNPDDFHQPYGRPGTFGYDVLVAFFARWQTTGVGQLGSPGALLERAEWQGITLFASPLRQCGMPGFLAGRQDTGHGRNSGRHSAL